jgi:hypothetical protein
MTTNGPKKVGGTVAKPEKVKKAKQDGEAKPAKPNFDFATAKDAAGAAIPLQEGKLTAAPANYEFGKFAKLKKSDFASKAAVMEFQANAMEFRAGKMMERAASLRTDARNTAKFGDEATVKKAKKMEKLRKALAALEAELEADGVQVA